MCCGDTSRAGLFCLKLVLAIINVLLGVYSLLLVGTWVWSAIWLELYMSLGEEVSVLVPSLLLSLSLSTLLLSSVLCCCLPRQTKPILLYSYSVLISLVYLVQLVSVILLYVFRRKFSESLAEGISTSMSAYGKIPDRTQAVDLLQSRVGCCGSYEPKDWTQTHWGKGHQDKLPHSCCRHTDKGICKLDSAEADVFPSGCHELMWGTVANNPANLVSGILMVSLLHLSSICLSICLARLGTRDYTALK
ncbi:tetraspanin-6-like [Eurytemora carolleeae]|uniref:tetraspanin-6-like n=1 Tax=Eurytemora carolleeae TaxID=1294199 RepID=UPI000C76CD6B|nr:tetraspanin-6-like [Eurytemora carolleeae]|eukprot:XP_023337720.1 tetraspanin-6-like [Eurytemora affinis]